LALPPSLKNPSERSKAGQPHSYPATKQHLKMRDVRERSG
jgi:hypothetical protein